MCYLYRLPFKNPHVLKSYLIKRKICRKNAHRKKRSFSARRGKIVPLSINMSECTSFRKRTHYFPAKFSTVINWARVQRVSSVEVVMLRASRFTNVITKAPRAVHFIFVRPSGIVHKKSDCGENRPLHFIFARALPRARPRVDFNWSNKRNRKFSAKEKDT